MSELSFKTRMNVSVRGLPKVYFCCHPKDFKLFFEEVSNEILSKQNCSVWYHGKDDVEYNDEFYNDLLQMNLFVVPVTSRFLKKGNSVLENEFRFAQKHHIPILPLMQEQGLDKLFNELCGDIQYLDKFNNDGTCIQYSDKLEKFLSSVLVGDELAEKIRCAFDSYVFLSYRKKDRYHAQELMKLIHKNEFCRDIAIWYDEFLVPGENFNSAISEALQKSDLFVLAVTPNLVNENNYVMNVEFPMARESGKPILPCEMVDTDKALLTQKYENIPDCADGKSDSLSERLRYHFRDIATGESNSTPEHLYFIGLAYLNGIDVEVDRERALELITSAAEQNLPEAIRQLVNMYTNGDGVKYNRHKAFEWRKKLLSVNEEIYEQEKDYNSGFDYVRACFELSNAYYDMDLFEDSIVYSNRLKHICELVESEVVCCEEESYLLKWHFGLAEMLLGQSYHAISDLESAEKHYKESKSLLFKFVSVYDDNDVYRDIAILYNKMAQMYKVKAEYDEALKCYDWALNIQKRNLEEFGGEENLAVQVATLCNMSEVYRLTGDLKASEEKSLMALKIIDELTELYGITKYVGLKMRNLLSVGDSYRIQGDLVSAKKKYEEAGELESVYIDAYGEIPVGTRALRLGRTTQVYFQLNDYESVIEYGKRALEMFCDSEAFSDKYSATGGGDYSTLCFFVGAAYYNGKNDVDNAIYYLERSISAAEDSAERGVFCNIPDLLMVYSLYADMLQMSGEVSKATEILEKAAAMYKEHLSDTDDLRSLATIFNIYVAFGKNDTIKEDYSGALKRFNKAEALYNKVLAIVPDAEEYLRCDYVQVCFYLAINYYAIEEDDAAKKYFMLCAESCELIAKERYTLADWNFYGISCYQMYNFSKGFFAKSKWKKKLIYAVYNMKTLYPEECKHTLLYEELSDTGIFD